MGRVSHREHRARILAELKRLRAGGWVVVAAPTLVQAVPPLGVSELVPGWHVDAWHRDEPEQLHTVRRENLRDAYAHLIMACDAADAERARLAGLAGEAEAMLEERKASRG